VPHAGNADDVPKQVRTLDDVLKVLDYALAEALPLENSVQRGRLLVQIAHAFIEAIKTGELEQRLSVIEAALKIGEEA
jgi:DNA-binding PucR family transcriptional regulator